MLLSAVVSAGLARARGYSALLYGALGLMLNLGAVPLTWLVTSTPLRGERPEGVGFTPVESELSEPSASEDLQAWEVHYHGLRQGLALAGVGALGAAGMILFWLVTYILPTFVALFEGMSLALPLPTQMLIEFTKFMRSLSGLIVIGSLGMLLPTLAYWLVTCGYWLPFFGKVWLHADRLWQLYARGSASTLPPEVRRRLGTSTPVHDLPGEIARARDRLSGAIWMCVLGLVPIGGALCCMGGFMVISIFLPLYQLIGNIGA